VGTFSTGTMGTFQPELTQDSECAVATAQNRKAGKDAEELMSVETLTSTSHGLFASRFWNE